MTNLNLCRQLPNDIKCKILLFNENFIMRNGEIITIIPKSDERYRMLLKKSIIIKSSIYKALYGSDYCVTLPKKGDMAPHFLMSGKDRNGYFILLRWRGKKMYPEDKPYTHYYHYIQ
jgi:hypothetical protein